MSLTIFEIVHVALGAVIGCAGIVFVFLGVIGLLRFPDLFTRTHAFSVIAGVGAALTLTGVAIAVFDWRIAVHLFVLVLIIGAAGPVIAHLAAGAAHAGGLAPLSGAFTTPRPGPRSGTDRAP
ncbi:MAG: monovalent cation/H(+) antiporter subunit G [Caulobacterales bacterium]